MNKLSRESALALALRPINPHPLQTTVEPSVIDARIAFVGDIYPFLDDAEKVKAEEWRAEADLQLAEARKAQGHGG